MPVGPAALAEMTDIAVGRPRGEIVQQVGVVAQMLQQQQRLVKMIEIIAGKAGRRVHAGNFQDQCSVRIHLSSFPPSPRVDKELTPRSEERRVGKEWVSTCRSRWR